MTRRAIGLCSWRRTTRPRSFRQAFFVGVPANGRQNQSTWPSRSTRRLRAIHCSGGSSLKGRLGASVAGEEMQWHTHALDRGKAGVSEGSGNDLSEVEGAQEVPENCSFPAVVPETEIYFHLEQEREIIPTRAGVRPPRIVRVGRLVGTLQGTDRG